MTAWPQLPLAAWQPTYTTLHLWTQILGKTRLALSPPQNHWWHVALYVSTRGLTTSPMPHGDQMIEVELDFVNHWLVARTTNGASQSFALHSMSVAAFYAAYLHALHGLGVDISLYPVPCEVADCTPFSDDTEHAAYDADAAHRCWQILVATDRVMEAYRGRFLGKSSPVHLWWGAFDLACTRFSGREAPLLGPMPYIAEHVVREAYSHECMSVGWWPGGTAGVVREPVVDEPAYYAYVYPEPQGFAETVMQPGAYYHPTMHEWILPYEVVRTAHDPELALSEFLDRTYVAAATCARWPRRAFERAEPAARDTAVRG